MYASLFAVRYIMKCPKVEVEISFTYVTHRYSSPPDMPRALRLDVLDASSPCDVQKPIHRLSKVGASGFAVEPAIVAVQTNQLTLKDA